MFSYPPEYRDSRTAANVLVNAFRRQGDLRPAWELLVKREGAPVAREMVRGLIPDGSAFRRAMDALGVPSDADLACASCGIVLDDPAAYAAPHSAPSGTPCRYVRVYDVRYLESDVCDGDFPRDDVRESVTACVDDADESAVELAARTIRELGLTEEGEWFSDPDGSQVMDYGTGERSEGTAHLYGFTDAEAEEIIRLVTA